jgi:hypothetical protein
VNIVSAKRLQRRVASPPQKRVRVVHQLHRVGDAAFIEPFREVRE